MRIKKITILLFTLLLSLVLIGQLTAQAKFGPRTESFLKIFESGTYYMKATMVEDSMRIETEVYMKGNRLATTTQAGGETMRMIMRDNKAYMIMEEAKMIIITPAMDMYDSAAVDISGMTFRRSGTATFAGKNLPYEEYSHDDGETSQFFIDGNRLAGIRSITPGENPSDMIISVFNQNVPDSVFNIPSSGYQIQDMSNIRF